MLLAHAPRAHRSQREWHGDDKLLNTRIPTIRNQTLISVGLFVFAIWAAWQAGNEVASENVRTLEFVALGFAACAIAVAILRSWRTGFYFFLVWMLFEDLVRKYMGNNLALFFGKDILLLLGLHFVLQGRSSRQGQEFPSAIPAVSKSLFLARTVAGLQ